MNVYARNAARWAILASFCGGGLFGELVNREPPALPLVAIFGTWGVIAAVVAVASWRRAREVDP